MPCREMVSTTGALAGPLSSDTTSVLVSFSAGYPSARPEHALSASAHPTPVAAGRRLPCQCCALIPLQSQADGRALKPYRAEHPDRRLLDDAFDSVEAQAHLSQRSGPPPVCRPLRQASPHSSHQQASLHHCAACMAMIAIKACIHRHKRRMRASATHDQILALPTPDD